MADIYTVVWGRRVEKQLCRLPQHIQEKFLGWVELIKFQGVREIRKFPGFHDEPLKGARLGQRSIRLNQAYRAIYIETQDGSVECLEVIEVNKHEY